MYNKIINWLTTACLFALSVFSLLSAYEIRQLNKDYENMYVAVITMKTEVENLKLQVKELNVQEEEPEPEVETGISIDWDYDYVLRVVAAECRGEPLEGQMAVAQVIQERADAKNMTPEEIVKEKYQFAAPTSMDNVNDLVREACERVFLNGEKVTDKPIKYFYSTVGGFVSANHEKKTYVMTIGNHKFFMD